MTTKEKALRAKVRALTLAVKKRDCQIRALGKALFALSDKVR